MKDRGELVLSISLEIALRDERHWGCTQLLTFGHRIRMAREKKSIHQISKRCFQ